MSAKISSALDSLADFLENKKFIKEAIEIDKIADALEQSKESDLIPTTETMGTKEKFYDFNLALKTYEGTPNKVALKQKYISFFGPAWGQVFFNLIKQADLSPNAAPAAHNIWVSKMAEYMEQGPKKAVIDTKTKQNDPFTTPIPAQKPMVEDPYFVKMAGILDSIADRLEAKGFKKEALAIDKITNQIEAL
jgi:hypothetical protein